MTRRALLTLIAVVGALAAGIVAQSANSSLASGAWAFLAGIGVTLMLRGASARVLSWLLALLAAGSAVWAFSSALPASGIAYAVAALAACALAVTGAGSLSGAPQESRPRDAWQAMDAGEDPTLNP